MTTSTGFIDSTGPGSRTGTGVTAPAGAEGQDPRLQDHLRIVLAQANPTVGDLAGNRALAQRIIERHRDADLIIFSECFLPGYPLEDLVLRPGFLSDQADQLRSLIAAVQDVGGPAILIGANLPGADLPFNAAILIRPDGTTLCSAKVELPNMDVFDEVRTFAPGGPAKPLEYRGWLIGAMICEDMWKGRVSRMLSDMRVDFLAVLNGSPFEVGKQRVRQDHARRRVRESGAPLVYVNQVGGQDSLVFDGASFAMNRNGHVVAQMPFDEGCIELILSRDQEGQVDIEPAHTIEANTAYPEPLEAIYRTLVLGVRDYVNKNDFPGVLIGLSGGFDSALTAAIAVDALGPERVRCIMMPTSYTSGDSLEDAAETANVLGVSYAIVPVGDLFRNFVDTLNPGFRAVDPDVAEDVTEENIQARIRAVILMAWSNKFGFMLLTTSNKSEMAGNFGTYLGDQAGGFAPLSDIYKSDAYRLGGWRNTHHVRGFLGPEGPVIPERILTKAPSAELRPDQTDADTLGDYETELDPVLTGLVEERLDARAAAQRASRLTGRQVSEDYAREIAGRLVRGEYKRRQAPPGVKISRLSFGKGWRNPITSRYAF